MVIETDIQKLEQDALIALYELDATIVGGPISFFTPHTDGNQAITFDGNLYNPVPIEAEGFEISGKGVLPSPTIRIVNVKGLVSALINEFGDLVGSTVTRRRTYKKYLDGEPDADPTAILPLDIFIVDRKSDQNKVFVEWQLRSLLDQEGKKIPKRQVLRDACTHIYRIHNPITNIFEYAKASCPYVGIGGNPDTDGPYFKSNGDATGDISLDLCGKRLSDCQKRFRDAPATPQPLPTRAFPGIVDRQG